MQMTKPQKWNSVRERLDWHFGFFAMEDRFVHSFLMIMLKRESKRIKTMAVRVENASIILSYNTKFVDSLTDKELRGVIKHEIYHIVFHHCTHRSSEDPKEHSMDNKAADLAINCLIKITSSTELPEGVLFPSMYGFPEKLSREQYLSLLREKEEKEKENKNKGKGDQSSGGSNSSSDDGEDQDDDEDQDGQSNGSDDENDDYGDGKGGSFDSHEGWEESSIADEIIRNKIAQISKTSNGWGNMPGDLQAMILAAQTPQIPWTKYLRYYLGQLVSSQNESTFKRPNRRFGYPYSGTKRKHLDTKLVAIDTSGSISDDDLQQFLAEINKLQEINPVDLVLFDTDIQYGPKSFSKKHVSFDFKGRGGTHFQPVIDLAVQKKYSSLIILTDGHADSPEKPAFVKDTLWVITENGKKPVEWGNFVQIVSKDS